MDFLPFAVADAAKTNVTPISRRRNTYRHRRTRKEDEDNDPYLGLGWGRQIEVDQSFSLSSPSSPIEFVDWMNKPTAPPEQIGAQSTPSPSHSRIAQSMPSLYNSISLSMSMSTSMSSPSRSIPISTPTYMPDNAGMIKEPPLEDSSTEEEGGGLQTSLIVTVVVILVISIAFLIIRRRNVVEEEQKRQSDELDSESDDDSKDTDEASAKERDPEDESKSDELKQEPAGSKKIGVFTVANSKSWIPSESSDYSGSNIKEPKFIPAISSDDETDYKSTNEVHPEKDEECKDEDYLDVSDEIHSIVRSISQLDATAEPNESKGSDHTDHTEELAIVIEEATKVERALLDEILTGMKTPQNSPDMSAAETEDADVPNDTVEMWREELRQDLRSGIEKMTSIHQQMLDQQAMLQAPPEIRNEYYRVISRTAIQRAELESKKLAVETKRAELELKMLDLQLRKVEIQEKELVNKVSSSEGSDIDQRDMIEEDALASRSQEQVASK